MACQRIGFSTIFPTQTHPRMALGRNNFVTQSPPPRTVTRSCLKYDRLKELKEFDATKQGVKGIADAGPTKVPRIFALSPEDLAKDHPLADQNTTASYSVPAIDMELTNDGHRADVVDSLKRAAETVGFFHVVNHGVPSSILKGMLNKIRAFHELPAEEKMKMYDRGLHKSVVYSSNFDLYKSKTASWRDTLTIIIDRARSFNQFDLHEVCRDEVLEYSKHVERVSTDLFELLSEALGLGPSYLKDNVGTCELGHTHLCHYYPPCPQPELAQGIAKHTDPSFITVLIKDNKEGLQVLHQNMWFDVAPVDGGILINIGDFLQLLSNGKFMSRPHRASATKYGPRVSVATFVGYNNLQRKLGPIKELLSETNGPIYKEINADDYTAFLYNRKFDYDVHALDQFIKELENCSSI